MASIISNEKYSLYYQRISLIYQRPEVRASLEVILSVFTITILIFLAIRPTLTNIATLQKKIEDEDILNKKADNKITQLFSAQGQLSTYQGQLHYFDEAVPSSFSYYDMAARIEYLARKYDLLINTEELPGTRLFGSGKPYGEWGTKIISKDTNNLITAGITFTVSGNPQKVVKMLTDIENMDRVTLLTNINFSKEPGATAGSETLKASGQIFFYFYSTGS